jgi:hypothetical protein
MLGGQQPNRSEVDGKRRRGAGEPAVKKLDGWAASEPESVAAASAEAGADPKHGASLTFAAAPRRRPPLSGRPQSLALSAVPARRPAASAALGANVPLVQAHSHCDPWQARRRRSVEP